ncbi:MAG: hypothetical protein KJO07_08675 [Deltaproteobacteria bacterium]|nr:hypothetical protein [Deltaproteobacteria bacterium]
MFGHALIALALALALGCGFDESAQVGGDDGGVSSGDGGVTGGDGSPGPDAMPPCLFGSQQVRFIDVCSEQPTSGLASLTIPNRVESGIDYIFDTDDLVLLEPREEDEDPVTSALQPVATEVNGVAVIWAVDVSIEAGAWVYARGSRPLAIVADNDLTIDGRLSVDSWQASSLGPAGSQPAACALAAPTAGQACFDEGASAGGGAAFRGRGGAGGGNSNDCDGLGNPLLPTPGGTGSALPPDTLRGGCAGADGAESTNGSGDGPTTGGGGGGALYLLAKGTLLVNGAVTGSGAGGSAGDGGRTSGSGGGSGGYLVLQAGQIQLTASALVVANGGGGGGGCDGGEADDGANGSFALVDQDTAPAGGDKEGGGGVGGNGGYRGDIDGQAGDTANRGGGGGGGAGFIVILTDNLMRDADADVTPAECGILCN